MNTTELFYKLKEVVANNPEKFFMNISYYNNYRVAMFDYSLTIPADFNSMWALEARGSTFLVDENNEYLRTLALPFEKFFNLHEYDYETSSPLHTAAFEKYGVVVKSSNDIEALPIKNVFTKEDGSIITAFELNGLVDTKSNSSLTSEYADKGLELIHKDPVMYDVVQKLTYDKWSIIFEFTSNDPKYKIVLDYNEEKLIVLAVRNNVTGEYMDYHKVVELFGESRVVKAHNKTIQELLEEQDTATEIEGYIVETTCGLRYKMKTRWYIDLHRTKSHYFSSGRNVWESFIKKELDDVYEVFNDKPEMKSLLDQYVSVCDNVYREIIHYGQEFFDTHKNLEPRAYFKLIREASTTNQREDMGLGYASSLYTVGHELALEKLHSRLLMQKYISKLGIAGLVG